MEQVRDEYYNHIYYLDSSRDLARLTVHSYQRKYGWFHHGEQVKKQILEE
jgi:heme oxygenase